MQNGGIDCGFDIELPGDKISLIHGIPVSKHGIWYKAGSWEMTGPRQSIWLEIKI